MPFIIKAQDKLLFVLGDGTVVEVLPATEVDDACVAAFGP